ncbi:unnamed protein product [Sphagnum jensenii]|uniref:Leucine carboxyl methyltransferase 1 homolog n=1 Tax=Sphagnum jensenii TaxID=128206 RepID=A0ABP0VIP8_9BRYO
MAKTSGSEQAVQATNDDATISKLSCVKKGYISDDFVQFFVRRPIKRSPIINRGYYARWAVMRQLLFQFLDADLPAFNGPPLQKQILSLGAGFDTSFFQLVKEGRIPHIFVEVDFSEVTRKKAMLIAAKELLLTKLGLEPKISIVEGEIISEHYRLLPADLRDLKDLDRVFLQATLDPKQPTLIIAECVLIYLEPHVSRAVVKWAADKFETAAFVIYEQIHPNDAFGQQMLRNLESRGCPLLGLHDTPTLESKEKRFTELGWQSAAALDMDSIYNQQVDPLDRRRIEQLEIFDEFEEWNIMQEHYCVAYGVKDKNGIFPKFGFNHREHSGSSQRSIVL